MKHSLQPPAWHIRLQKTLGAPYMQKLNAFLQHEYAAGKVIYPKPEHIFQALHTTPFAQVKVVILGQDPYHGEGQAHGLSFSVPVGVAVPPSLKNIYKELQYDLGINIPHHGCLESWAKQGVLLLNSVLTVEQGKAGSHQNKGWELFTDEVIALLNDEKEHVVFILWGAYAQKKGACIDASKHLVLRGLHPSPLSAHRGFFKQHYFSQTNAYLEKYGQSAIDWSLPVYGQTTLF
ncbi:uracil-DNA glycosylase [Ghiorsea bivora]|uniref:uracil-DNA glycosylase n=1 Tax=Ghiorsea bivora TaxID=1485545 RepID=UPI00056F34EC|nr:uracil-DNA glycosylase [Ghiorsea bivora]